MKFDMNFDATSWALAQLPFLPSLSCRLVLINIAARYNEKNRYSWTRVDRIAIDVGASERTVQRAIRKLEQIGVLRTHPRPNKPSLYFLNFDFLGVGDKVPPHGKKVELGVTKSRARGDFLSPLEVTESHLNKLDNKLINKQQQPVVVFEDLIFEKPLTEGEKAACLSLLASSKLPVEVSQQFLDEMAGSGRQAPIRNATAWLANMLSRHSKPGFSFGYAPHVAAQRAGRAQQALRESLTIPAPPPMPAAVLKQLSEVGRNALAAMGRHPKLVTACHQTL